MGHLLNQSKIHQRRKKEMVETIENWLHSYLRLPFIAYVKHLKKEGRLDGDDIVENTHCSFDCNGKCAALTCFSSQKCNSRNKKGVPKYYRRIDGKTFNIVFKGRNK